MSLFYGWKISALAMGGNFMIQGVSMYGMNAFMEPLCDAYGWTRMGLNFSMGLAALMGQIAMPITAAISNTFPLRWLMAIGALAAGLSTCAMGLVSSITLFTICLIILFVSSQLCGGVVGNALITNWFSHYRGIAFGLANSGSSFSGMIVPFIALVIIRHYNITVAYLALGLITCALAPLSLYIVRRKPSMLHLHPDGAPLDPPLPKGGIPVNTSFRALVKRPAVWWIGLSFGLSIMASAGILSQMKPRFSDAGMEAYASITLSSVAALFGTLSKYFWGWLCDKTNPVMAARLTMLTCLLSILLTFLPHHPVSLTIFAIAFATSCGGVWVILPAVTAWFFGSENFLGVYRFIAIFILLRCLGFPLMGISYEYHSSYALADGIFAICFLAALIMTMLLKPTRAVEYIRDREAEKQA